MSLQTRLTDAFQAIGIDINGILDKLGGIESGATADQTGAEIKTLYESEADTNAFTDADHSKLDSIQSGAQVNRTPSQIKSAYEGLANTNAYTDSDQQKVAYISVTEAINLDDLATNEDLDAYMTDAEIGDPDADFETVYTNARDDV